MDSKSFDMGHDKLIIALDFGTTYSGIAYCFAHQRDNSPISVDKWAGAHGIDVPKIPTIICYNEHEPEKFVWGGSVAPQSKSISEFKLLLDPSQPRPKYLPKINVSEELGRLPKPPIQITADFIGAMYGHAITEITKKVPSDYVEMCQKEYILSVPAVWSDAAKNATVKAAQLAGLTPVRLIKEPEAATLWTTKKLNVALGSGDVFVVCDAGGGTVDLVSYEVETTIPRLQVKEIIPGTGGMAGSLCINKRFESAVRELVGEEQWSALWPSKGFQLASAQFDKEIKKGFQGHSDDEFSDEEFSDEEFFVTFYPVKLKDDPDRGLESNTWTMVEEDLKQIFDPVINDILGLIGEQIDRVKAKLGTRAPKYIFLVGGFGSNRYLMRKVSSEYRNIEVLQPPDAWAAIAKGAALSSMSSEATVMSFSATRHYGVKVWTPHNRIRHEGRPFEESVDGDVVTETMEWFINRGDDLSKSARIAFNLCGNFPEPERYPGNLKLSSGIYECQEETAPLYPLNCDTFRINCMLLSDLSKVPQELFVKRTNRHGKTYHTVILDLVMTLESALMKFSLEIDGVSYGSVEAKYCP